MTTGPPTPDNRRQGNGHSGTAAAVDSLDARPARLTTFWALVLGRFRDYANRGHHPQAGPERRAEEDK